LTALKSILACSCLSCQQQ